MTKIVHNLVLAGFKNLSSEEKTDLAELLVNSEDEVVIATILTALKLSEQELRGEDLAIFVQVLLAKRTLTIEPSLPAIDICGTGGDGKDYFNISTTSAIILAAMADGRYQIIKHGNVGSNGRGASDVLRELGYELGLSVAKHQENLEKAGLTFAHAPSFYPFLKFIGGVRKKLPFRTIFNLLGPILTPAKCINLLGVSNAALVPLYQSYFDIESPSSAVIASSDGCDEIVTVPFAFSSAAFKDSRVNFISEALATKYDKLASLAPNLVCSSLQQSKEALLGVLGQDEEWSFHRDIVTWNVAVARYVIDMHLDSGTREQSNDLLTFTRAVLRNQEIALEVIKSGKAKEILQAIT